MKKIGMLAVVALFMGCGGSSSPSSVVEYDMWEYIASKTSRTSLLDVYTSNSNWSIATNKRVNEGYIEYTVSSSTQKIVDFNGKATATFVLNGNFINIAGTNIGRYKSIGSTVGKCTLLKHHDTLTIATTYTFSDVLEFDCGDYKEFYGKDKGTVANYTKSTFINGQSRIVRYGISVINN